MTEKEKAFAFEYIKTRNMYQSAITAGYSPATARGVSAWLKPEQRAYKPDLAEYIAEKVKEIESERTADAKEVIEYLTSVMRGESTSEVLALQEGNQSVISKHPEERDRINAANSLAKILGIEKQNININATVTQIVDDLDE